MGAEAPIWQGESERDITRRYVSGQRSEQRGQMGWIGGQTGQGISDWVLTLQLRSRFLVRSVGDYLFLGGPLADSWPSAVDPVRARP
jgi:hypothetical protein